MKTPGMLFDLVCGIWCSIGAVSALVDGKESIIVTMLASSALWCFYDLLKAMDQRT